MTTRAAVPAEPSAEIVRELVQRAARPDFARFEAQLRSSGYCARPIRLQGRIETCDGNGHRRVWSTSTEPDGILRKACGNRREAVCPSCAERYRGDAYQLIAAGLRGGKRVPESVVEHPALFVTLTAPSFGLVHTRPLGPDGKPKRCRPRRDAPVCSHGVRLFLRRGSRRGRSAPRRAALPGLLRPRRRRRLERRARRAVAAHDDLSPPRHRPPDRADAEGAARARARLLRQGRRVPAPRPGARARRGPGRSRDAHLPCRRGKPPRDRFGVDLLEEALCLVVDKVRAPLRTSSAAEPCTAAASSTSGGSVSMSGARSRATWRSTRPEHRACGRRLAPRRREPGRRAARV
jgi:hypothetical protein